TRPSPESGGGEHAPQDRIDVARSRGHVVPGEPDRLPPRDVQDPVAPTVLLKRPPRAMGVPTVDLDDDPLGVPDEVALPLLTGDRHPLVDRRRREPGALDEREKAA